MVPEDRIAIMKKKNCINNLGLIKQNSQKKNLITFNYILIKLHLEYFI